MKKLFLTLLKFIPLFFLVTSCGEEPSQPQGYDGREYDISLAGDGRLIAISTLNGPNYRLEITGNGEAVSYDRKELVPWNPITKRVNEVKVNDGITNIGDYYFYSIPLDYIILPASVNEVKEHSFNSVTTVYTYGGELTSPNEVYYYRANKPATPGKYFYMEDGVPHPYIYNTPSILFIGNSFTFRQGSEDDPAVPRYFKSIASNLGVETDIDFVVRSSYTLTKYADKNDELGSVVERKLTSKQYDYVVLQEQSTTPINSYSAFLAAVVKLNTRIGQTQRNCKTILYETWGSPAGIEGTTYQSTSEMELALRSAYESAAREIEATVHYVGKAFAYAYETLGINIYADDNRHQSNLGAYYSASVHVRSLFNFKVANCTNYCGLDETGCKALLQAADYII